MIIRPPTEPRRVLLLTDPALADLALEPHALAAYARTRDWETVREAVENHAGEPLTVATIAPLSVRHRSLVAGGFDAIDARTRWEIVRAHLVRLEPDDLPRVDERGYAHRVVDRDAEASVPLDVVDELARLIVDLASCDGDRVPFSAPGGSWESRLISCRVLRAMRAAVTPASTATTATADE